MLREAVLLTKRPGFKGYIHDVGGPTANFRKPSCQQQKKNGLCAHRRCLTPKPCPSLQVDHSEYLSMLRQLRNLPDVKRVFIRSGIRFDYIMLDKDDTFFRELVEFHVSGQLKVAPEHCCGPVLDLMGKPRFDVYRAFSQRFYSLTKKLGKKQYLVPYLISSHPGCTMQHARDLTDFLKREGIRPEQAQDFYPTPGTLSTCMFYTGIDPRTMEPVHVPRTAREKAMQRALLQYRRPANHALVREALVKAGREDLIGYGRECLVPPWRKPVKKTTHSTKKTSVPNTKASPRAKGKPGGKRK